MPELLMPEHLPVAADAALGDRPGTPCKGCSVPGYVTVFTDGRWHCNWCGFTCDAPPPAVPLTEVDLTAAALWVLGLRDDPLLQSCYRGALGTWAIMLSMDDEQALAHAETLAAAGAAPVRATVPPF